MRNSANLITIQQIRSRLDSESDPLWRFRLLLDLGEFCIKVYSAVAIAALRSELSAGDSRDRLDDILRDKFRMPTLGTWTEVLKLLKEFLDEAAPSDHPLRDIVVPERMGMFRCISDLRNDFAHGATPLREIVDARARELEQLCESIAAPLESDFAFRTDFAEKLNDGPSDWSRCYAVYRSVEYCLSPCIAARQVNGNVTNLFVLNRVNGEDDAEFLDYGSGSSGLLGEFRDTGFFRELCDSIKQWMFDVTLFRDRIERVARDSVPRTERLAELIRGTESAKNAITWVRADGGYGKSTLMAQLIAELEETHIVVRHFCSRASGRTDTWTKTKDNLINQVRSEITRGSDAIIETLDGAVEAAVAVRPGVAVYVVLDGLDEMHDLNVDVADALIDLSALAEKFDDLRIVIAGQPKLDSRMPESGVRIFDLNTVSEVEIQRFADKYELRAPRWSASDGRRLAEITGGFPIFVDAVMRDIYDGRLAISEVYEIPHSLENYWRLTLDRAEPKTADDPVIKQLIRETESRLRLIAKDRPELVPDLGQLTRTLRDELSALHARSRSRQLLFVLLVLKSPATPQALCEILGLDTRRIEKWVAGYGSVLTVGEDDTRALYHGKFEEFLRSMEGADEGILTAENLVEQWLTTQRDSESVRSFVWPYYFSIWKKYSDIGHLERRQEIESILAELIEDRDFLLFLLRDPDTHLILDLAELLGSPIRRQILESFNTRPRIESSRNIPDELERSWQQRLAEREVSKLEAGEEAAESQIERFFDESPDPGLPAEPFESPDDDDGDGEDDLLARYDAAVAERREIERQKMLPRLKEEWLGDSVFAEQVLDLVRSPQGSAVLEAVSESANVTLERLALVEGFLKENWRSMKGSLQSVDVERAFDFIVENSTLPPDHPLRSRTRSRDQQRGPQIVTGARGGIDDSFSDVMRREPPANTRDVLISAHATRAVYLIEVGKHRTLVVTDWVSNERIASKSLSRSARSVGLMALSGDGNRLVYCEDQLVKIWRFDERVETTLQCVESIALEAITSDLRFGIFKVGELFSFRNAFVWVDLDHDRLISDPLSGEELQAAKMAADGSFAVIYGCRYRTISLWRNPHFLLNQSTEVPPTALFFRANRDSGERSNGFVLSPNGQFIYLSGELCSLTNCDQEENRLRVFDDHGPNERVYFSPDSRFLAMIGDDGSVRLHDLFRWELVAIYSLRDRVGSINDGCPALAFSADGRFIRVIHGDSSLSVLDLSLTVEESARPNLAERSFSIAPIVRANDESIFVPHEAEDIGIRRTAFWALSLETLKWTRCDYPISAAISEIEPLILFVDAARILVAEPGFVINVYCRESGNLLSRKDLVEWHTDIDWAAVTAPDSIDVRKLKVDEEDIRKGIESGAFADEEEGRKVHPFKLKEIGEMILGSKESQLMAGNWLLCGAGPNVVLALDPDSISVIDCQNTNPLEVFLDSSVSPGSLDSEGVAFYSSGCFALWNVAGGWFRAYPLAGGDCGPISFDSIQLFGDRSRIIAWAWGSVRGRFDLESRRFETVPKDSTVEMSPNIDSFPIRDFSLVLGGGLPTEINFERTNSLRLIDPFAVTVVDEVFFERTINRLIQVGDVEFVVLFDDSSTARISVRAESGEDGCAKSESRDTVR